MNYSTIKNFDIANGEGVGVSLFVSGCSFYCKGCFNQDTWDFASGDKFTTKTEEELMDMLSNKHIDHFSVLGGEPMNPQNVSKVCSLINKVHELYPNLKIWIWTGYNDFDELYSDKNDEQIKLIKCTLKNVDYMTFGRFILSKKNIKRKYSGSDNQYTLNLKTNTYIEKYND